MNKTKDVETWQVLDGKLWRAGKVYAQQSGSIESLYDLAAILNVERATIEAYESNVQSTALQNAREALERIAKTSNRFRPSATALHYQGLAREGLKAVDTALRSGSDDQPVRGK